MYPNLVICLLFVLVLWGLSMNTLADDDSDELAQMRSLNADQEEVAEIHEIPRAL